jgi:uncharacterized membrane protein YadS
MVLWVGDASLHFSSQMFCVSGHEVVIVKNGQRICGSGGALASAPLVQSKAYFEVKIQQSGNHIFIKNICICLVYHFG